MASVEGEVEERWEETMTRSNSGSSEQPLAPRLSRLWARSLCFFSSLLVFLHFFFKVLP